MRQDNIISALAVGITIHKNENLTHFLDRIIEILNMWADKTDIIIFPEYCWGKTKTEDAIQGIEDIIQKYDLPKVLVLGTLLTEENGLKHNSAVIVHNNSIEFRSKTNILLNERENGVKEGKSNDIIDIEGWRIGILICADLWNARLVESLVQVQKADILLVPAFTVVPPDYGNYSRELWYSLVITRSREFTIPIVIADHDKFENEYDVGRVTCVIDPSRKSAHMKSQSDFISTTSKGYVFERIDLEKVKKYREYRIANGMLKNNHL